MVTKNGKPIAQNPYQLQPKTPIPGALVNILSTPTPTANDED